MNRRGREMHFDFGRLSLSLLLLILQSASADNIVSRPVGFLRVAVPPNAPILASRPFSALDQSNAVMAEVLKWDVSSGYTSSATSAKPGEGFWLVNKQSTNQIVFLAGEVALSPSNTALLYPGLNLVGYPYSSPLPLNKTALGSLTTSVEILDANAKTPGEDESVMGKGYWVKSLSRECIVWTEVRPYENVFPESGLPEITAIATEDGSSVILTIACEGSEVFDVFYQDISSTNRFDTARNWRSAKADLRADGRTLIEWVDAGAAYRSVPGDVLGRYYLVGRADVDLNRNGVPDARDRFVNGVNSVTEPTGSFLTDPGLVNEAQESLLTSSERDLEKAELTNNEPVQVISVGRVIYVDLKRGSDNFTGRAALAMNWDGPKKTIRAGLNAAEPGDVVVVREGKYSEDLNVAGRDLKVVIEGTVDLTGPEIVCETITSSCTNTPSSGETVFDP